MKIALVHDFLVKMGGAERVLKLFADMYPKAPIYTLLYDESKCGLAFPKERVRTSFLQKAPEFLRKRQRFLFPLMPRAVEGFDFSDYDLVISSSNAYAHGILTPSQSTHICYCHSPMRYVWDYAHEYLEEQKIGRFTRFMAEHFIQKVRFWDQVASDRPDVYVANSIHVKNRIKKYYHQHAEVLYPPVDISRFKVARGHDDFFLIVSALTPFKKVDMAVQLFNKIQKKLVVIGGGAQEEYLRAIAGPTVQILGSLSDDEVTDYMKRCRAYVMPAEEDFGIAPVEAMACGKPVLAYGKGGVTETVIPGETGEFFYEPTLESMEDALGRLIVNEPEYDAKKIRANAERFSEKNFVAGWKEMVKKATAEYVQ